MPSLGERTASRVRPRLAQHAAASTSLVHLLSASAFRLASLGIQTIENRNPSRSAVAYISSMIVCTRGLPAALPFIIEKWFP